MNRESAQNSPAAPARQTPRTGALLKKLLGWAVAVACLWWVFHDVEFDELASRMTSIGWGWVTLAIGAQILSYVIQGYRWKILLRPTGDLSVLRTSQAIYVGLFANTILPLRVGELVRMFLVSRWLRVEFMAILPSYLVERMIDAIWLAITLALVALFVPLPGQLIVGEQILVGFIVVAAAAFVFAIVKKERARGAEPDALTNSTADPSAASMPACAPSRRRKPFGFVSRFVDQMANGFHKIGLSRNFLTAAVVSLGLLVFQVLALWLVMPAMGIQLSVWQGTVAFLILRLGTSLPNAPSNLGSYQFFAVVALEIFGIDKTTAASFSVVSFLLLTLPLAVIGLIALWRTGMSFSAIRSEVANLRGSRVKTSR
jgi:uncharacterized protein (TIRG00374 family)